VIKHGLQHDEPIMKKFPTKIRHLACGPLIRVPFAPAPAILDLIFLLVEYGKLREVQIEDHTSGFL